MSRIILSHGTFAQCGDLANLLPGAAECYVTLQRYYRKHATLDPGSARLFGEAANDGSSQECIITTMEGCESLSPVSSSALPLLPSTERVRRPKDLVQQSVNHQLLSNMHLKLALVAAAASFAGSALAAKPKVPSLNVPACPRKGTISYSKSVPDLSPFPRTQADLCYTDTSIEITFKAYEETNFYFDPNQGTNDDIWAYEVMEVFIHRGTEDPQTYLEFEVNPNNVTYQAFIYNPSKVREAGAAFDHFFVSDPAADGFSATTKLNRKAKTWISNVKIPLGLFNVDVGAAKGTKWRFNFFRTVTGPDTYPDQQLGAWSPPDAASFHKTPFFGNVNFV